MVTTRVMNPSSNRVETYGLEVFGLRPLFPAQRRFLLSDAPNCMWLSGRGSGKSTMGVLKLLLRALEPRHANTALGLMAPTYRSLVRVQEKILQTLLENFERNTGWSLLKRHRRADHIYQIGAGVNSEIWAQSFERVERIRGLQLSNCYIDEIESAGGPGPWYTYGIIAAAVRGTGQERLGIDLTTTPAGYRGLVKKFVQETSGELDPEGTPNPDFQLIISKTADNPYLPKGFVERLEKSMSKSLAAQELYAKILRPSHTVYDTWSRKTHVVPFIYGGEPFSVFIDWGYSHAYACFCAHISQEGEKDRDVIFWECAPDDMPEQLFIDLLVNEISKTGLDPEMIVGDRAVPRQNQLMMRAFPSVRVRTMKTKEMQSIWRGVEITRSRVDPADGQVRLFCAQSLIKNGIERGAITMFEQLRRRMIDGVPADQVMKDNVLDHSHDAISMGMRALYKHSFMSMETAPRETGVAQRRLRAFHKRI